MIIGALAVVLFALIANIVVQNMQNGKVALSFEDCVFKGFPVAESYPRQCTDGAGVTHVEVVEEVVELISEQEPTFTYEEARERVMGSVVCSSEGEVGELLQFDTKEGEWWFGVHGTERPYCDPACVLRDPEGGVRLEWRCP